MRPDFGKCVIEKPRVGSNRRNIKIRLFGKFVRTEDGPDYDGFTRIPMSFKGASIAYGDHKGFSDLLGPIRHYLRSSCGRLWDEVYSEIAHNLKRGPWPIQHIVKDHLDVAVNTWRGVSGKVWHHGRSGPEEVGRFAWRGEFYVEPETGILRETPRRSIHKHGRYDPNDDPGKPPEVPISEGKHYIKLKGIWYYREFEMTSLKSTKVGYRGRVIHDVEPVLIWERKQQLNKKELRDLKLVNDRP